MYKTKQDVQDRVQEHYNILIEKGYEVVGVYLNGSQNYEIEYEGSDVDTKAIILPKFEDFLLNRKPVSTTLVLENNEHIDLKDIRLMFENFKKQNINFVEILFTEYKVLNPMYIELFQPMFDNKEEIAHYNNYKALKCIAGMSMEKYKALEHPYPATKHKIDKFGFDGKQLSHLLRLNDFIQKYANGYKYVECLKADNKEYLIKVKQNKIHTLDEARIVADYINKSTYRYMKEYMNNNEIKINKDIERILKEVLVGIIKLRFKSELK